MGSYVIYQIGTVLDLYLISVFKTFMNKSYFYFTLINVVTSAISVLAVCYRMFHAA